MKIDNTCIILTGCINPEKNIPYLTLTNSIVRREQYIQSILFFLDKSRAKKIIFCDNSNAPIEDSVLKHAIHVGKDLEWLSFSGNNEMCAERGKGYGEGEIIKYIFDNSRILKSCTSFVKVTGRFKILNINDMLLFLNNNNSYFDFYENYVDTRCYIANINQFKCDLINQYKYVNDSKGYYLEHAYFDPIYSNSKKYKQLPMILNIVGQSGSTGGVNRAHSFKGYLYRSFIYFLKAKKRELVK